MARIYFTGDKQLDATLKRLADKEADRIAKSALGAGLTVTARAIRKEAPVGPSGNLKAAIGKRLEKAKRGNKFTAKTGINVGKKTKAEKLAGKSPKDRAPHAHLVGLGSKPRTRKALGGKYAYITNPTDRQLSTGTMPKNPFVRQAAQSSRSAAFAAMRKRAAKSLDKAAKNRR